VSAEIRIQERSSPEARCAFCHGDLDGVVSTCKGCGTVFHDDCRMHLVRCPTLGCATSLRTEADGERERPAWMIPTGTMWERMIVRTAGQVSLVVIGIAAVAIAGIAADRFGQPAFAAAALLGLALALWQGHALTLEPSFYREVRRLLDDEIPAPMTGTVRREGAEDRRRTFVDLTPSGPGLAPLSVEVTSSIGLGWLVDAAPGAAILVYGASGTGPVVLRRRQGVYAVPGARVRRG
jgi:hypothetical protein